MSAYVYYVGLASPVRAERVWALGGVTFLWWAPLIAAKHADWCPKCQKVVT